MADAEKTEKLQTVARSQTRRVWVTPILTVASVEVAEENPGAGGDGSGRS